MNKKIFLILGLVLTFTAPAFAIESDEAKVKAKEAHELAGSNVIYQEQEERALYYQNIEIINLLTEIRDLLKSQKATSAEL